MKLKERYKITFKLDLYDLYEGYVEATAVNPLDRKVIQTDSTWTYFVINHFAQLGRLLGFEIELEKMYSHGRNDLVWYRLGKNNIREIFLHLESETGKNLNRSLEKLRDTPAKAAILVTYSETKESLDSLVDKISSDLREWRKDLDILAIVTPIIDIEQEEFQRIICIIRENGTINHYQRIIPVLPPLGRSVKIS